MHPRNFWTLFRDFFWYGFAGGLGEHLALVLVVALVASILFGGLGAGYGVPQLFWHKDWRRQALAGAAVTLLLGKVFFVAYLLMSRYSLMPDTDAMAYAGWARHLP